jgi:hypothetical protein
MGFRTSVAPGSGHERRMILAPPCDGHLGPVHVLGLCRHDRVHLDAKPVIVLLDVGLFRVVSGCLSRLPITVLISLPFRRQAWRRPRQLWFPRSKSLVKLH